MPNKNYLKGVRKERKICKDLKDDDYLIVQRTAGSHSAIDVIAIDPDQHEILLIQSKPNNFSDSKTKELYDKWGFLTGHYHVKFEVR